MEPKEGRAVYQTKRRLNAASMLRINLLPSCQVSDRGVPIIREVLARC